MALSDLPEITFRTPTLSTGLVNDSQPEIILDWSIDIDTTQFSNDATREQLVIIINPATQAIIPTTYVGYAVTNRRLTLRTATLDRNTTYKIFVRNQVLATNGRKSQAEYEWEFKTGVSVIGSVTLLDPANQSIQTIFPTLSWTASTATGSVLYRVQIDDRFYFPNPTYDQSTSSTSLTPIGAFSGDTTWYWRVVPYTTTASGEWSEVRSFWFGDVRAADPTSSQIWQDPDSFGVSRISWKNGLSNQAAFPTISITFTSTPASDFANYITVKRKAVIPRNDDRTTYLDFDVTGSWTLSGKTITFTPSEAIKKNTRYDIHLSDLMLNTVGIELGEEYNYYFTGQYDPYYVDIRMIRSRLMSAELQIPDDLINFYIHSVSLEANARFYGFVASVNYAALYGDSLKEVTVRDQADMTSFGVLKWVEAGTVFHLLCSIRIDSLREVDRSRKLGDYQETLGEGFLKGLDAAIAAASGELQQWQSYLIPSEIPLTVSRSSDWSPTAWYGDMSVLDVSAKLDGF